VTIFTIWFQNFPNNFVILIAASAIAGTFIFIFAKSAMVAEGGRQGWVKRITGPNAKILFSILFVLWALVFGIGLQLVPHEGASSPYGGLGLIALFSGFFIIMGLAWSVIGD
jgi:Na+/H+ antiporter NhaC